MSCTDVGSHSAAQTHIDSQITVLVPTSPIPSHPSTELLDKVIASIRFHLPESKIIIMADGVRSQVGHRAAQYEEYLSRVSDKLARMEYGNAMMPIFTEPTHQAGMTDMMLDAHVDTPYVAFFEHDVTLVTNQNPRDEENTGVTHPEDCVIRWDEIVDLLESGGSNLVRFYLWEKIWHEHQYLMRGQMIQGSSRFIQTVQFSGWPFVARTDYLWHLLTEAVPCGEKTMIEPAVYGLISESSWEQHRLTIYLPEPNGRRFYHLNGRVDATTGLRDSSDW